MVRDAAVQALAVLCQAENNPDRDEGKHEIQYIEQCLSANNLNRVLLAVEVLMEAEGEVAEAENEHLLYADAYHVDMQPPQDLGFGDMVPRRGCSSEKLDQEGDDVEQHEIEPEAPGLDAQDSRLGCKIVYHSPKDHVHECVRP